MAIDIRFQHMIEATLEDENTIGQEARGLEENTQQMEVDEPQQNAAREEVCREEAI